MENPVSMAISKNVLSVESIAKADVVILATDIEVNTDRFVGKRVYRCSTGFALKQTDKTFANAIAEAKVLETGKQTATKTENENKSKNCHCGIRGTDRRSSSRCSTSLSS